MNEVNELIKIQLENLVVLKTTLMEQQKSIINNKAEEMSLILSKEEDIVKQISTQQSLIDNIPGVKEKIKLSPMFKNLKEELLSIISLNHQNRVLVDSSKYFIKTLLTNLIIDNHNLLDRKV